MFDKNTMRKARAHFVEANNCLVLASRPFHEDNALCAIDFASAALDLLGYDVVQRQTPQQAHEAAVARRVAETPAWEPTR